MTRYMGPVNTELKSNHKVKDFARGDMLFDEQAPFSNLHISREGRILYANRWSWLLLSHWKSEVGGLIPQGLRPVITSILAHKETREIEEQIGFKTILLLLSHSLNGKYVSIYGLDVTNWKKEERKGQQNEQIFESIIEGVMIVDGNGRILGVNPAFSIITKYPREEILGENTRILNSDDQSEMIFQEMWKKVQSNGSWQGEISNRRKNGENAPMWMSVSTVSHENGSPDRFIILLSDITVLKQTQDQLYKMAHFDVLTGLANRRNFNAVLNLTLEYAKRTRETVGVMYIDLDNFKYINDHMGHLAGDKVLLEVGKRLKDCVRNADTVARLGGDEFITILPALADSHHALIVAEKMIASVARPITIGDKNLVLTTSIGISIFPGDATVAEDLVQCADLALYRSKELGKNGQQFYSIEMNDRARKRITTQGNLRQALDAREFLVYYQPQFDLRNGQLVGLEALARWQSPNKGVVSAEQFISVAEETGVILELGKFVMNETCLQGQRWLVSGLDPVRIAVNISSLQLRRPDFIETIEGILHETGFPPECLELELTESMLVLGAPEIIRILNRIKAMNIRLSIDDFGTKYSSLKYLRDLPIDRLKIDRCFIKNLPQNLIDLAITSAIITLGQGMNLEVIAEGVETDEQVKFLRGSGCQLIQGYFSSPAIPADELDTFLNTRQCPRLQTMNAT